MATDKTLTLNDDAAAAGKGGKPRGKGSGTLKKVVMWTLGILITLGFAYGSGMRVQVKKLKAVNAELREARTDARAAKLEIQSAEASAKQLEARRRLHLALLELDNRNFGVAQEHLRTAAALLQEADRASTTNFNALSGRIRYLSLVAASDISGQRDQVLALVREMDSALADSVPKPQAAEGAANASAEAASTTAPGGSSGETATGSMPEGSSAPQPSAPTPGRGTYIPPSAAPGGIPPSPETGSAPPGSDTSPGGNNATSPPAESVTL